MAASTVLRKVKPVVVILGCTGAGKSKLAIELACKYNGEIISADSMQLYSGLDIVTNKVTEEERKLCRHHMMDYLSPLTHKHTVVDFRNKAVPIIDGLLAEDKMPVIVGGTNYYIQALLWDTLIAKGSSEKNVFGEDVVADGDATTKEGDAESVCTTGEVSTGSHESNTTEDGSASVAGNTNWAPVREVYGEDWTTAQVYEKLQELDPASARRIHPNDRRKLARALQVVVQHGVTATALYEAQPAPPESPRLRGALRYPHHVLIWVQCEQEVLNDRINRRVDKMIEAGLIAELTDFHHKYNEMRVRENETVDYTLGIFQSIGFKEFHNFLLMSEEQRKTHWGQSSFESSVEDLKRATRRYAKYQVQWVTRRFLTGLEGTIPPVYGVDATDPERWDDAVLQPATAIIDAVLRGETPVQAPLPLRENDDAREYNKCDVCGTVTVTRLEWSKHVGGRRHKKAVAALRAKERREEMLRQAAEEEEAEDAAPVPTEDPPLREVT